MNTEQSLSYRDNSEIGGNLTLIAKLIEHELIMREAYGHEFGRIREWVKIELSETHGELTTEELTDMYLKTVCFVSHYCVMKEN